MEVAPTGLRAPFAAALARTVELSGIPAARWHHDLAEAQSYAAERPFTIEEEIAGSDSLFCQVALSYLGELPPDEIVAELNRRRWRGDDAASGFLVVAWLLDEFFAPRGGVKSWR